MTIAGKIFNTGTGDIHFTSGNSEAIALGGRLTAASISLTSAAGIAYTSGSLSTTGGDLSLTAAGDIGATGSNNTLNVSVTGGSLIISDAAHNAYISSTAALKLGTINVTSLLVGTSGALTSGSNISFTGSLGITGADSATLSFGNAMTFDALTTTGALSLTTTNSGTMDFTSAVNAGSITLDAAGDISGTGQLTTGILEMIYGGATTLIENGTGKNYDLTHLAGLLATPANLTSLSFTTTTGALMIDGGGVDFATLFAHPTLAVNLNSADAFTTQGPITTQGALTVTTASGDINLTSGINAGNGDITLDSAGAISGSGVVTTTGTLVVNNTNASVINTNLISNFGGNLGANLTLTQSSNSGNPMTVADGLITATQLIFPSSAITLTINTPAPLSSVFHFFPVPTNITNTGSSLQKIALTLSANITTLGSDSVAIAQLLANKSISINEYIPAPIRRPSRPKPKPTPENPGGTPTPPPAPGNQTTTQIQVAQASSAATTKASTSVAQSLEKPNPITSSLSSLTPNYTTLVTSLLTPLPTNMTEIMNSIPKDFGANTMPAVISFGGGIFKIDITEMGMPDFLRNSSAREQILGSVIPE